MGETPDPLAARLALLLPEAWRNDVALATTHGTLVLSFRDAEGRRHALSMRPARPDVPSLVPSEVLAFAHEHVDDAVDPAGVIHDYRAALTAIAAHEVELLARLAPPPSTPDASSSPSPRPAVVRAPSLDDGPEWMAFEAGLKPAIRVVLPRRAQAEALSRKAHERAWGFFTPEHPQQFTTGAQHVAYVARDDAAARALAEAERASLPSWCADHDERARRNAHVGRLLGYPDCCADAFAERMRRGVTVCLDGSRAHEDYAAAEDAARASAAPLGRLNNLLPDRAHPRLVTWYPCRYDCPASADFAAALFAVLRERSPDLAAAWERALVTRRAIDRTGRRLAAGETSGDDPLWVEFATF